MQSLFKAMFFKGWLHEFGMSQQGWGNMENLRSKPLALMPICRQTVAAALIVETKMNWSSAASLVHACPSAGVEAPSVSS